MDHIDPTPQKHNHTLTLSRETKIPPIRRATEQLGWDLEYTHTHNFKDTHTHTVTHVHRRIHGRLSFKSQ